MFQPSQIAAEQPQDFAAVLSGLIQAQRVHQGIDLDKPQTEKPVRVVSLQERSGGCGAEGVWNGGKTWEVTHQEMPWVFCINLHCVTHLWS